MGSVQILNPAVSLFSISQSRKKFLRFRSNGCSRYFGSKRFKICCAGREDDEQNKEEEPPESLFMKELRKRGMTPTSLIEDAKRGNYGLDEEMRVGEEGGSPSKRNAVSTDYERNLSNQREESMQLNSEGLEGLIPRAKLLLSLGGTFFLAFWPLILLTVAFFCAIYLYFGSSFIHDGSNMPSLPPQYVDPYALLEDERISQTAPRID